jgi:hypothetical protein
LTPGGVPSDNRDSEFFGPTPAAFFALIFRSAWTSASNSF